MIARAHPNGDLWEIICDGRVIGTWFERAAAEELADVVNRAARRESRGLIERAAGLFTSAHIVEDHAVLNAPFPSNVVPIRRKG